MTLDLWLAFVAASIVLLVIPGPTIVLVLSYAISQGRRVALAVVAGVSLGDFTLLKWIGAAYLAWMGLRLLFASRKVSRGLAAAETAALPAKTVFTQAFVVTALNPKSIAFFVAFVPQFIRTEAPLLPQFAVLVPTFVILGALNALAYALLADRMGQRLRAPAVLRWLYRAGGGALIGMGAMTAMLRRA